jgi:ribosomal protein S18 acetylase RimI-like enzyme
MAALQTLNSAIPPRPALAEDEPLLFALFAAEKRPQLVLAGLPHAQVEMLVGIEYRGREMTYSAQYPEADNSILLTGDGMPAGRLLLDRRPDCWRIVDIAVLAVHRGRGLATAALEECQARCSEVGARLELQVAPANPARRLYERLGFRAIREDAVEVAMVWSATK